LREVGRYLIACFGGSLASTVSGILALFGDGLIKRSDILRTSAEWWMSDALAFVAFTPFALLFIAPGLSRWLHSPNPVPFFGSRKPAPSVTGILELGALFCFVTLAICFVFGFAPAIPYQPLYLLFIPLIWSAVRRGVSGAALTTFAVCVGMTIAAWLTQEPRGSLPRFQLVILALGVTGLCLGAVVDERKTAEHAIRASEERYRLLFARNLAGVFRNLSTGPVLECNPAAAQILGYESAQAVLAVSSAATFYFFPSERESMLKRLKAEKAVTNHELRFRRKDGTSIWVMLNLSIVEVDSEGVALIEGTLIDITKRKVAEEQIQSMAYYDALTGLPNRTLFRDRLMQALAGARRQDTKVALLFLDLDRFKDINDSLGHSTGDLLLQNVAERLKSVTREQDTVARLGGDEFVIVLTQLKDAPDAAIIAERCMDRMTAGFVLHGRSLGVGCSIGISIFPDHGGDAETLLKHADAAMYRAKEIGRNNFQFFAPEMNKLAMERLTLENGLRRALERKELFLVYQPQMKIASGSISGCEALLRWRHPELGLVPPDRFIRVAENSGLIIPIGQWVLETACREARKWHTAGLLHQPIAVNVSAVQFRYEGFCDLVRRVLQDSGLSPQDLVLELTESLLLANESVTQSVLRELKNMGIGLALDDFGTGYSSLAYLKRFPVTKLKIDRSFVRDVATNSDDAAITVAIINVAKSLNLHVIAEGVEDEAQMSFLQAHGCDEIQGYYFSQPLSAEEFAVKLRKQNSWKQILPSSEIQPYRSSQAQHSSPLSRHSR
jgi:diguanylate cyclase (GGDEF)-like protein/PAS domain S-box-containing protein